MQENPFTPTFGEAPVVFAGRSTLLRSLSNAYQRKQRDPFLTTLVSGARGTGKTSLLTVAGERAKENGWVTADVSAIPGMLEDIIERVCEGASHLVVTEESAKIIGLGIGQLFNIELERPEAATGNWRTRMNRLLDQLEKTDTGLLITVDEVTASLNEMITLASVYQHFVRENRKVALLLAGLPHNVSQLLQDKSVSFLRRAKQVQLGRIGDADIESAFIKTIRGAGKTIGEGDTSAAISAIDGFPFMLQLVGYHTWEGCTSDVVSATDIKNGIKLANSDMKNEVLEASWKTTSAKDREFLAAMAEGETPVTVGALAERMGVGNSYAGQYKYRLLEQGLIEEPATGLVDFALPTLREFVAERSL
jgi:hypothetical protein